MKAFKPCLLCSVLLILTGCYHFGTPQQFNFGLESLHVDNKTKEPVIGPYMTAALREHIATDSQASLAPKGLPKLNISVSIKELDNLYIARAKMRDKDARDDDSDAYQSVLFRIALKAEVVVTEGKNVILQKTYKGYGDLPKMHDRDIPLKHACKQAVNSIANQIVDDLATSKL